jgi:hypothetical protein
VLFQHTFEWIVKQSPWTQSPKTMTTRRFDYMKHQVILEGADVPDTMENGLHGKKIKEVQSLDGRTIWRTGGIYAVQPGRGKPGIAHIRIKNMYFAAYAYDVSRDEAFKEGFDTPERFQEVWIAMHGENRKYAEGVRIEFELVERMYAAHFIIDEPKAHKAVRVIKFYSYSQVQAEATAKSMAALYGYELDKVKEAPEYEQ